MSKVTSLPLSDFKKDVGNMHHKKSSGNDGLTKEFREAFWEDIKNLVIASLKCALNKGDLTIPQK